MAMSASSKKRLKKTRKRLDRAFSPTILSRANEIAISYRIVLTPDEEVGYIGNCVEMPLVMGDGRTPDACVSATRSAIVAVVAYMLESGSVPPSPAGENRRDQQVNIRLTVEEKASLEEAARQQGFRGVSDYVRSVSLQSR